MHWYSGKYPRILEGDNVFCLFVSGYKTTDKIEQNHQST